MNAPISNSADCEVRGAEKVRPSEIHRRLVAVYGEHVMNADSVRKWCTMFRNGRTDVHDAERSGRPSVITDALKQKVNRIIRENRHFTISEVYEQYPDVSRTVVYQIVTEHLQYRKICARWVPRTFWYEEGISKLV
jgi:Cdc6-like AAA superfamily ATPase